MRRRILAITAATMLLLAGFWPPAHAADQAQLYVLHAVPDLTVDVYVNGKRTINNFKPGTLAGPLKLDPGTYTVAITKSDAENDDDPAIGPVDLDLKAGGNYTAVAHLKANGDPTATLFENDTSMIDAGQGRLTVRHVAAAPAVDVLANGKPVIENLSNPKEKSLDLPAGTVEASVAAAGTTKAVLGPADVTVKEGALTIAYAWGSLDDKNLKLATQTITGMHSGPGGVDSGQAGLAGTPAWPGVLAALVIGLGGALVIRRSTRTAGARHTGSTR